MSSWAVFSDADFNPQIDDQQARGNNADPWSAEAWPDVSDFHKATNAKEFERDIFDMALDVFAEDAVNEPANGGVMTEEHVPQIHVALHEQLSSLYSGTDDPESQVNGSILVQRPEEGVKDSFCFVVKDKAGQLEAFQEQRKNCEEITELIPFGKTEVGDRVLRVTYPSDSEAKQITVATYTCSNVIHPVPLVSMALCLVFVGVFLVALSLNAPCLSFTQQILRH